MTRHSISTIMGIVLLFIAPVVMSDETSPQRPPLSTVESAKPQDGFSIQVFVNGAWHEAGRLSFDKFLKEKR